MFYAAVIFQPISEDSALPLQIGILVLPDSNMLSLAATIDPLRAANRFSQRPLFEWQLYSTDGEPVRLTTGIQLNAEQLPAAASIEFSVFIVLCGFNVDQHASSVLIRKIRNIASRVDAIGGVEGGSMLLAETGLLRGHRATTHWEDLDQMAESNPDITVVRDRFVVSKKMFTTGGASPCIDLMLHMVSQRHGRALAERVAGAFIYDPVHSGSDPQSLVSLSRLQSHAPKVARAISLMETHLEDPLPIPRIAEMIGLSTRRLETLFRAELGESPASYFRALRLAEARRMTVDTQRPFQDIAVRSGFNSQSAFTRAFVAHYGESPGRVRRAIRKT